MFDEQRGEGVVLKNLLAAAARVKASDIHLVAEQIPVFRMDGELVPWGNTVLTEQDIHNIAWSIMKEEQKNKFSLHGDVDFAYNLTGVARYRVNIFRHYGGTAMAVRLISDKIPTPEELLIPSVCLKLVEKRQGLILVTGAAGSGKSTTLASLIGYLNRHYARHIITLEDPIEYIHLRHKSLISQREIGTDCPSFPAALRAALRQDPDVILIGEMRDKETIRTALTAGASGHLVLGTLHTQNTVQAIERMVDIFSEAQQQEVRAYLASVLEGVIAQRLIAKADGTGRVAAFEVLVAVPAVRHLIRTGKDHQLLTVLQTGTQEGMQSLEKALRHLADQGLIKDDDGQEFVMGR